MLEPTDALRQHRTEVISAILHALGDNELDEAQAQIENLIELTKLPSDHPDILVFRVLVYIQRGEALNALHYLNGLDQQHCPDLRTLCLYFLEDPLWEGLATELAESDPRPHIRTSMGLLINRRPGLPVSGVTS
ncbi:MULTISPECIES: HrpB1 family type III secretion system apparatus protein [unclassified Cupriavidus]|uniref:HrpB1 family type III secretion system apparatus protein n=1 Tax=unclassified Cupriavidus TaxID=2640874 RepID=UPI001AE11504|nr:MULTISPECIES: HrpB1 family type III secretion system apparatus protein [unclassified Cupriavidus]MBP0633614.1 hypothetical protein [Cupriavidus sp. AcVe19-1a]MBP0640075.1 hypothetical protein [Cupriavidus sp. AcVe19-6a]